MEICILNPGVMDPSDFAFAWRAAEKQWREHILPAWEEALPVPAAMGWTVSGFTDAKDLVPGSHFPIQVVPSTNDPGVLGDHTGLRALWKAFGRTTPDPVVFSHEVAEMGINPFLDTWVPIPESDDMEAVEVCDRVQYDKYSIEVSIGGVTRDVLVSNFCLPGAFGLGEYGEDLDYMGLLQSRDDIRGYRIVRRPNGTVVNEFAKGSPPSVVASAQAKVADMMSRTWRLLYV